VAFVESTHGGHASDEFAIASRGTGVGAHGLDGGMNLHGAGRS